MDRARTAFAALLVIVMVGGSLAAQAAPNEIHTQGILRDANGDLMDGEVPSLSLPGTTMYARFETTVLCSVGEGTTTGSWGMATLNRWETMRAQKTRESCC